MLEREAYRNFVIIADYAGLRCVMSSIGFLASLVRFMSISIRLAGSQSASRKIGKAF